MNILPNSGINRENKNAEQIRKSAVEYVERNGGITELPAIDSFSRESNPDLELEMAVKNLSLNSKSFIIDSENTKEEDTSIIRQLCGEFLSAHPKIDNFIYDNTFLKTVLGGLIPKTEDNRLEECLDKIHYLQTENEMFSNIQLLSQRACTYPKINMLVFQELGVQITPGNISDYKKEIKGVLETKRNRRFSSEGQRHKISQMLNIVNKMEELKVPVYIPKTEQNGNDETFNFLYLAKNARYIH